MNLSKKYSTWTTSSNRIHFTRTLYISFDVCKLSCCLHVHEIDTGTKGKDLHPNPISELFEIKKKNEANIYFLPIIDMRGIISSDTSPHKVHTCLILHKFHSESVML